MKGELPPAGSFVTKNAAVFIRKAPSHECYHTPYLPTVRLSERMFYQYCGQKGYEMMRDTLIKTIACHKSIRAYAAVTTDLVNQAAKLHSTLPVGTAALGRALTAVSMMGAMLKEEGESVSIQFKGGGPLGTVFAMSEFGAKVRGYVDHPLTDLPLNAKGKLDVGGAIGTDGMLSVVRQLSMGDPYVGQVPLISGEIGDDLTVYYAKSEQIPTAVGLGVLVDVDYTVKAAGGFIISLLPGAEEETVSLVEQGLQRVTSVTDLIVQGADAEGLLQAVLGEEELEEMEQITPSYCCRCSLEKMERGLISLGREELENLAKKPEDAELVCHFCNHKYYVSQKRLLELAKRAKVR